MTKERQKGACQYEAVMSGRPKLQVIKKNGAKWFRKAKLNSPHADAVLVTDYVAAIIRRYRSAFQL